MHLTKKTSGRRALNRAPSERAPDEGVDGIGDRIQKEGIQPVEHFAAQRLRNRIEGHICICFCAYVLQLEMERLLKAANSTITIDRARELVKTMYALTYTKPGYTRQTKVMLGMDEEQAELYRLVDDWVSRELGNA